MLEFNVPLSLKIGPGVNSFGLAVKRNLHFKVCNIIDSEDFSIELDFCSENLNKKNTIYIFEKIKKYISKEFPDIKKKITISIYSEKPVLKLLNPDVSIITGVFIAFFKVIFGECDQDKLLRTFKKISPDVECAAAVLLGGLGVVDREKKSFLSIDWPTKWKIAVLKCSDEKVCKFEKIKSKDEFFFDSVSKAAVFITAVYSRHSDILFSSFQDNISYAMNRSGIPYVERINLIGKTSKIAGLGFLKNDCGLIIVGEEKQLVDCIRRIEEIYNRNNIVFSKYRLDSESNGVGYD
ncbi:MAG: hypothetical protein M0R46_02130 [Candidatus Muirbacterium halophilum]|nr:hypothetical protein [Candidatus Muirbacterium halophilum]MCK9474687.1 hypothetical protein [Candidatus Muirbacterium halophilum]